MNTCLRLGKRKFLRGKGGVDIFFFIYDTKMSIMFESQCCLVGSLDYIFHLLRKVSTEKISLLGRVSASMLGNIIVSGWGRLFSFCLPVVGLKFVLF